MKKSAYLIIALLMAAVCAACGGGAFKIEGHLSDAGTQNLRAVYLSGDTVISQWVPSVDGKFTVDGKADGLMVVYLYNSQMKLVAHVAVDNGDKVTLEGSIADNYNIAIEGTDINKEWNAFVRAHAADFKASRNDATDKAIADFIAKNPKNVVSTLLLTCDYSDLSSPKAQQLLKKIDKSAKPDQLMSLYSQFFNSGDLATKKINALKLRNDQDSIVLVRTYDHPASVIYFWRGDDNNRRSDVAELRAMHKGSRVQVLDVCLDTDTLSWRRTVTADSTKWQHYRAIGGPVDKTIVDLNVKGSPFFIVADSTGTQIYRGAQINGVRKALDKKHLK